jgi:hypothetical protein
MVGDSLSSGRPMLVKIKCCLTKNERGGKKADQKKKKINIHSQDSNLHYETLRNNAVTI